MGYEKHGTGGYLRVWPEATRIDIIVKYGGKKRKGGGARGEIVGGFSAQSRKRLFDLLNSLRDDAIRKALFVTLTYKRNEVDPKEAKKNLKAFIQCLRRIDHKLSGIWKLEFQKRGSPHYHLIVFGRYLEHSNVASHWNRIAEPGDADHLAACTEVRAVRSSKSATAYVGKYMAKLEDGGKGAVNSWGRYWGVFNRKGLPSSRTEVIKLKGGGARTALERWGLRIGCKNVQETGEVHIYTRSNQATLETKERIINECLHPRISPSDHS